MTEHQRGQFYLLTEATVDQNADGEPAGFYACDKCGDVAALARYKGYGALCSDDLGGMQGNIARQAPRAQEPQEFPNAFYELEIFPGITVLEEEYESLKRIALLSSFSPYVTVDAYGRIYTAFAQKGDAEKQAQEVRSVCKDCITSIRTINGAFWRWVRPFLEEKLPDREPGIERRLLQQQ